MSDYQISQTFVIDKITDDLVRQEVIDRYPIDCPICGRRKAVQLHRLFTNDHGLRGQEVCDYCIYNCTRMVGLTETEKETE